MLEFPSYLVQITEKQRKPKKSGKTKGSTGNTQAATEQTDADEFSHRKIHTLN